MRGESERRVSAGKIVRAPAPRPDRGKGTRRGTVRHWGKKRSIASLDRLLSLRTWSFVTGKKKRAELVCRVNEGALDLDGGTERESERCSYTGEGGDITYEKSGSDPKDLASSLPSDSM